MTSTEQKLSQSPKQLSNVLSQLSKDDRSDCSFVYREDILRDTVKSMKDAFDQRITKTPPPIHAYAVKVAPFLVPVFMDLWKQQGRVPAFECASVSELYLVLHWMKRKGLDDCHLVLDSPCKKLSNMKWIVDNFVTQESVQIDSVHNVSRLIINMDNLQEYSQWKELLQDSLQKLKSSNRVQFGFRINPQVRPGKIRSTSTCHKTNKFGVPLKMQKDELIKAYKESSDWIRGIHVHVGSQGCSISLLLHSQQVILKLIKQLEKEGVHLDWFDIGGGLPVSYTNEEMPKFAELASGMDQEILDKYQILTEYGRAAVTKASYALAPLEYVKKVSKHRYVAIISLGADVFVEEAYLPGDWNHRFTVWDQESNKMYPLVQLERARNMEMGHDEKEDNHVRTPKNSSHHSRKHLRKYTVDIAGPLCFSGDLVCRELHMDKSMDKLERKKHMLVIHDAGSYTLGMYSKYNSNPIPPAYLLTEEGKVQTIMRRETLEESIHCWLRE